MTRKFWKIELYLQWLTDRKSYMVYQTAPFSMTLNKPCFQGRAILNISQTAKHTVIVDIENHTKAFE